MTVEDLIQNDTVNNHLDDVLVGVSYSLSAVICFIPYVVVLKAITSDKDLMKLTSYRIIVHMGIRDILQLIAHFISGPFTIFQTTLNLYVNKVVGGTATGSYVPYALMTLLLAFNRLIQLCFPHFVDTLFSYRRSTLWIAGCHGVGIVFFVCLVSPWAGMIYFPEWYSWDYDSEASLSWLVQSVEEWIEISVIIISGIIYVVVVIFLIITRKRFQETSNYKQEKRILIQAAVITIYCTILNVTWHNYSLFLPDSKYAYMGLNFMWIYNSGINPVIYLILNKTVQDKVKILSKISTEAMAMSVKRLKEQTKVAWSNTNIASYEA